MAEPPPRSKLGLKGAFLAITSRLRRRGVGGRGCGALPKSDAPTRVMSLQNAPGKYARTLTDQSACAAWARMSVRSMGTHDSGIDLCCKTGRSSCFEHKSLGGISTCTEDRARRALRQHSWRIRRLLFDTNMQTARLGHIEQRW